MPALDSLRHYSWNALGRDTAAGLTVATIAVPQGSSSVSGSHTYTLAGVYTATLTVEVGNKLVGAEESIPER